MQCILCNFKNLSNFIIQTSKIINIYINIFHKNTFLVFIQVFNNLFLFYFCNSYIYYKIIINRTCEIFMEKYVIHCFYHKSKVNAQCKKGVT